jgi:Ku protein
MAPRAYWKGSLKLSLVSRPVLLYPATTTVEKTRFHLINRKNEHRLKQQMIDAETGKVVEDDQKARGYEVSKGEYVEVDKEELQAIRIESTHTIDIDSFVPEHEIDKRYINRPYYIAPDGAAGLDAFAVIRDAMKDQDRVALARIVRPIGSIFFFWSLCVSSRISAAAPSCLLAALPTTRSRLPACGS